MKTTPIIVALCLSLAPAASAVARQQQQQPQTQTQPPRPTVVEEADFTLHRYEPKWVEGRALMSTVTSFYGRRLTFADRVVSNLTMLDDSVVIYETADRLEVILKAMEKLDSSLSGSGEEIEEEKAWSVDPADMVLKNFTPKNMEVSEFYRMAQDLYGRKIMVGENWHPNLSPTSNSGLVVYEDKAVIDTLLKNMATLDGSQAPNTQGDLVVREYQPHHLSPDGMMEGLDAFRTRLTIGRGNDRRSTYNITLLKERGVIQVRDREEAVAEIVETMERLDQPAPQVVVACQIVRGVNKLTGEAAKLELKNQLKPFLPYENYQIEAIGMLRGNAISGTDMQLDMASKAGEEDAGAQYNLEMRVGSFDPKSGALNLQRCRLLMTDVGTGARRELFSTETTIFGGEYAVLGVTGAEPLFLVVRVQSVQAK
jgi:hypothetical protein